MSDLISRTELRELLAEEIVENHDPEIGLEDIVKAVRKYGRVALLVGVSLAVLVSIYIYSIAKPEYRSVAQFLIPLNPKEGELEQEAYLSILKSGTFLSRVLNSIPGELGSKIADESQLTIEKVISFERDESILSLKTKRNSSVVSLVAVSREPETSTELASFVSLAYLDYVMERRNGILDEGIVVKKAALDSELEALKVAREELGSYVEKNPVVIPGRLISSNGKAIIFDEEGEAPVKQAVGTDMEYYELATLFVEGVEKVRRLRNEIEEDEREKEFPFRGIELLREAEVPLEIANGDVKKKIGMIVFAFGFGVLGWIVFCSSLAWLKEIE